MSEWLSSIGPAVGDHLWQSTVFAVAAALLTVLLKKNRARVRYWIWLAALMKFLVPFSLLIGLGGLLPGPRDAPGTAPTAYEAIDTAMATMMDTISEPFAAEALPVPPNPLARSAKHAIPAVVAAVWFCGLVVVLAKWRLRWRRVAAMVREATEAHAGRETELLRRLERDAGMQPVRLLLSRSSMEPGIFGVVRPALLWPREISARLSEAQMEAILAHELCHVRRRDNLFAMAQMVVEAVFWFYPLVWWMGTRLIEEREQACDEEVLGQGRRSAETSTEIYSKIDAEIYAESLLKICEFCLESPVACVSGITGADLKRRIVQIMSRHFGTRLSLGKKAILATASLVAIAGPVAFGVVRLVPLHVQILHATGPLPSYEVATIKPENEPVTTNLPRNITRFIGTTKELIEGAYNVPYGAGERVVGGPNWIASDRYVVEGMFPDDLSARMQTMSGIESRKLNELMKQSLLMDRFKLKVHFEMRELPVYELVIAKRGVRGTLAKADPNAPPVPTPNPAYYANTFGPNSRLFVTRASQGVLGMTAKGILMDGLAESLEEVVKDFGGRTIVNKTGLDGSYDFTLKWLPQQTADAPSAENAAAEMDAPSIFTALEEQLGLKLIPAKGMVEVVVIDSIERPSGN